MTRPVDQSAKVPAVLFLETPCALPHGLLGQSVWAVLASSMAMRPRTAPVATRATPTPPMTKPEFLPTCEGGGGGGGGATTTVPGSCGAASRAGTLAVACDDGSTRNVNVNGFFPVAATSSVCEPGSAGALFQTSLPTT